MPFHRVCVVAGIQVLQAEGYSLLLCTADYLLPAINTVLRAGLWSDSFLGHPGESDDIVCAYLCGEIYPIGQLLDTESVISGTEWTFGESVAADQRDLQAKLAHH